MNSYKGILTIAAIAAATLVISGGFVASALAASENAIKHAQRQGHGVCNADQKIHEHGTSKTDANFHRGVGHNFGDVGNFVDLDSSKSSRCHNPVP